MMLKNLILRNFIPFQFSLKILNVPHKNTFKITSVNDIYSLPQMVSIDPEPRPFSIFQFKISHTVLYLNKDIVIFGKTGTKLWSFCNLEDETALHLFAN